MRKTSGEKLFLEQEGVRQSMELWLDFGGSRKSGFNRVLEKQLRGRPFRDFQVAAPLKPCGVFRKIKRIGLSATSKSRPH